VLQQSKRTWRNPTNNDVFKFELVELHAARIKGYENGFEKVMKMF